MTNEHPRQRARTLITILGSLVITAGVTAGVCKNISDTRQKQADESLEAQNYIPESQIQDAPYLNRQPAKKIRQPAQRTPRADTNKDVLARMLIGEAEGYSEEVKIAIAYTALNRVKDKRWSEDLTKVILQPKQYSCFNKNDPNYDKVLNPEKYNLTEWNECNRTAKRVLEREDPTNGANHYHMSYVKPNWSRGKTPIKIMKEKGKTFLFYKL